MTRLGRVPAFPTLRHAIDAAAVALAEAGVGSPRADAELLAAHAAGTDRGRLAFADIGPEFLRTLRRARRPAREAGAAATPHRHRGVRPGDACTSAPVCSSRDRRPSRCWNGLWRKQLSQRPVIVDLCTGSGALALALSQALARRPRHRRRRLRRRARLRPTQHRRDACRTDPSRRHRAGAARRTRRPGGPRRRQPALHSRRRGTGTRSGRT